MYVYAYIYIYIYVCVCVCVCVCTCVISVLKIMPHKYFPSRVYTFLKFQPKFLQRSSSLYPQH